MITILKSFMNTPQTEGIQGPGKRMEKLPPPLLSI